MKKCPKCKTQLKTDDAFCWQCGGKLQNSTLTMKSNREPQISTEKLDKLKGWLIGIILVAFVAIIGWIVTRVNNDELNNEISSLKQTKIELNVKINTMERINNELNNKVTSMQSDVDAYAALKKAEAESALVEKQRREEASRQRTIAENKRKEREAVELKSKKEREKAELMQKEKLALLSKRMQFLSNLKKLNKNEFARFISLYREFKNTNILTANRNQYNEIGRFLNTVYEKLSRTQKKEYEAEFKK
jgi:hypothetical protein